MTIQRLLILTGLIAFSLLLYSGSFQADFHFDDYAYILNAPEITSLQGSFKKLISQPFLPDRSLVQLSFALNYAIHGLAQPGYQLINIIIHAANGFLLFLILAALLPQTLCTGKNQEAARAKYFYIPITIALLFIAHPLAVNSVAYIAQRHGLLATLFYLITFFCSLKAISLSGWRKGAILGTGVLSLFLSIHSKPMAVTLPLILILSHTLFLQERSAVRTRTFWVTGILLAVFVTSAAYYATLSGLVTAEPSTAGFKADNLWSPWVQFMTESKVFLYYLKLILLPFPEWLCADRSFPLVQSIDTGLIGTWLAHLTLFTAALVTYLKGFKLIPFGILWFYLTLSPYLFVPIQDPMVDYKTYLPSIGLMLILGEILGCINTKVSNTVFYSVAASVLIVFTLGSQERIKNFQTEISFWNDIINKEGPRARPLNNRGLAWKNRGAYERALDDFTRAIALAPEYYLAYANTGDTYLKTGQPHPGLKYYKKYLELQPERPDAHMRLGNGYAAVGDWDNAVLHYDKAVNLNTGNAENWYNLGLAYSHLNTWNKAEIALAMALKQRPDYYQAAGGLGTVFLSMRRYKEAEALFHRALAIKPDYPDALYNLTVYYARKGDMTSAYTQAKRLQQVAPKPGRDLLERLNQLRKTPAN